MNVLVSHLRISTPLMAALIVAFVGFGTWYQLSSQANNQPQTQVMIVDAREEITQAIHQSCKNNAKAVTGQVNDIRIEGAFAQATAVCQSASDTTMQPSYFTLKLANNKWGLLQQGTEPPLISQLPDSQLPLQFAHGE